MFLSSRLSFTIKHLFAETFFGRPLGYGTSGPLAPKWGPYGDCCSNGGDFLSLVPPLRVDLEKLFPDKELSNSYSPLTTTFSFRRRVAGSGGGRWPPHCGCQRYQLSIWPRRNSRRQRSSNQTAPRLAHAAGEANAAIHNPMKRSASSSGLNNSVSVERSIQPTGTKIPRFVLACHLSPWHRCSDTELHG